jgi:CheY-like chemotaxis protein
MNNFKTLVVDDEEDSLVILVKRLKKRGIEATGVKSGAEALNLIKKRPRDIDATASDRSIK